jgi:hypothetical protein
MPTSTGNELAELAAWADTRELPGHERGSLELINRLGLHARAASKLVQTASVSTARSG